VVLLQMGVLLQYGGCLLQMGIYLKVCGGGGGLVLSLSRGFTVVASPNEILLAPSGSIFSVKHKMIEDGKSRIQVNGKTFTILHLFVIQTQDDRRW
jgi:hypothetical protein